MPKVTFEMEEEQLDAIIVDRLKSDLMGLRAEVANMVRHIDTMKSHHAEDLQTNLMMIGAIEQMLKYYMVASEAEAFITRLRDTYWPENLQRRFGTYATAGLEEDDSWDNWFEPSSDEDRIAELEERVAELEAEGQHDYGTIMTEAATGRRYIYGKTKQRIYVDPED